MGNTKLSLPVISSCSSPIGIDDIADSLKISKFHFIREFSGKTGYTPGKYLAKIRIEKAVELLQNTDGGIDEIARKVGYSNGNYFSKVFYRYLGVSPGQFRRERRLLPYTNMKL